MSSKQVVKAAINSAVSQGMISAKTAKDILEPLDDIAAAGAGGVDVDSIDSEDATLVAVVIDASDSMSPYQSAVIDAYNKHFLAPLQKAKNADSIYVTTWVFSSIGSPQGDCRLVHGYKPVKDVQKLDKNVYSPNGMTPLNKAVHHAITGMVGYGQQLRDAGTNTKCIVVVLSDGEENSSGAGFSNTMIKRVSEDLLKQEIYILSYAFFGDESKGKQYADNIGFPDRHRINASLTDAEIRRIFGTVSASVISASQSSVSSSGLSSNAFFV